MLRVTMLLPPILSLYQVGGQKRREEGSEQDKQGSSKTIGVQQQNSMAYKLLHEDVRLWR
jgi:hypothetical protein